ncbi:MAG: toll/interleukin-1 receptor domain-containing protein [Proteobacteria bacterium]|nr:toll/interleukin-1 receptor domain-containing protein [Pseudomonadota bacterium]
MTQRMHEASLAVGQEYLAFISYRHADNTEEDQQWATWLHQQLEVYDVPDDLIGTTNLRGQTIPDRIYPVFRDEVSLSADADLSTAITQALDQSRFLIVLCSPRAVQSRYVNEEILHFKRTGKEDRIMAALILGEPNASIDPGKSQDPEHAYTLECFPPALQYELTAEGQLDQAKPTEPIAANFRLPDGGKGITNPNVYKQQLLKKGRTKVDAERLAHLYEEQINTARLKIIAGILGVPLERLTQRDKIHQLNKARAATRRFRKIAASLAVLTLVALIAGGIAVAQWRNAKSQQLRAENLLSQIRGNLDFMNFDLRGVLDKYVPQHERIKIMQQIDDVVEVLQQQGNSESVEMQRQIAVALAQKADQVLENDKLNPAEALPLYQQAHNAFIKLSQRDPGNTDFQQNLSVSHSKIGDLQLRLGNTDAAFKSYQDSLAIRQTLAQRDPGNTQFQRDLSFSHEKIGDLQLRLGNTDAALKAYQDSLVIAQTLTQRDPGNTQLQSGLSVSHERIGDLQLRLGNTDAALKAYQDGLAIAQTLTQRDPGNTEFQRDLSVSSYKLSKVYEAKKEFALARKPLENALSQLKAMQSNGSLAKDDEQLIKVMEVGLVILPHAN